MEKPPIDKLLHLSNDTHLHITCKDEGAGYLDTRVDVIGENLCWISYPELEHFVAELQAVVNKYRI